MAGLLSDVLPAVYSYGDTMKRKLQGLLDDPMGTIAQGVQNFGQDQAGLLNLQANAYPMAGDKTVLNTPEQIAQFRDQLAQYGAQQGMAAATVWHGSPHTFDAFDSSKIGTGEGAQAYGHGLYLAESPDVAQGYKTTLSPYELVKDGKQIPYEQMDAVTAGVASDIASKKGDLKAVRSMYENMANQKFGGAVAKQRLAALDSMGANVGAEKGGSLYKVDLPDEHIAKMLDWDKPLSQQHPDVQAIFNKNAPTYEDPFTSSLATVGISMPEQVVKGQHIYERMGIGLDSAGAAEKLRKSGIPGIRYLDGGSRGAGQGSSNYVVFPGNEGLLSILERNGQPLK